MYKLIAPFSIVSSFCALGSRPACSIACREPVRAGGTHADRSRRSTKAARLPKCCHWEVRPRSTSSVHVSNQVNGLARGMVIDLVREYRRGGNVALGIYRDKEKPARVG